MRLTLRVSNAGLLAAVCALAACSPSSDDGPRLDAPAKQEVPRAKARSNLQWKRYAALEADLARALELSPDALCLEFGKESCIRKVHLVPLGGHEPFDTGMLEAAAEPLATTPTVVERVVLSACAKRVALDLEAGDQAKVFKHFKLSAAAPGAGDASTRALITDLYRRLLARDAEASELEAVASLAADDAGKALPAAEFAKLACFTIGTTSEFLFF